MRFCKYHALGNAYIVLDPDDFVGELTKQQIRLICHTNYGIGADGVLIGPLKSRNNALAVRIFNPDGSEAEKSGNGLRIFARYLREEGYVQKRQFAILTPAGEVKARLHKSPETVTVEMGQVSFDSARIPVTGPAREVLNEEMTVAGQRLRFCAATIGNPHCVILCEQISEAKAREIGPIVETHPQFPNRTNVQFMKVPDRGNIAIEIWERGAGYTLASGTSSCAAGAVAYRLGMCDADIAVHMPGGTLQIVVGDDFTVTMTGPVTKVAEGTICDELFDQVL